jgi:hypothetical protein
LRISCLIGKESVLFFGEGIGFTSDFVFQAVLQTIISHPSRPPFLEGAFFMDLPSIILRALLTPLLVAGYFRSSPA